MGGSDPPRRRAGLIGVVVADKTSMGAQLLAEALRRSQRCASVAASYRVADVLAALADQAPDIALISADIEGDPLRGFKLTREISTTHPSVKVVMLLDTADREAVVQAFRAGSQGVFCRAQSVKELLKCIACVHAGQIWAGTSDLGYVLEALRGPHLVQLANIAGVPLLTKREMAVVQCVTEGLTNRETATQLNLSEHTVKNYMFRIFDKLGVSSRVELVLYMASRMPSGRSYVGAKSEALPSSLAAVAAM
jgi:two-component system nitrate/nitrite response regulator NarL